jgi:hypothetical protein
VEGRERKEERKGRKRGEESRKVRRDREIFRIWSVIGGWKLKWNRYNSVKIRGINENWETLSIAQNIVGTMLFCLKQYF